jgi:N-formylglutamate deformylase
MSGKFYRVMPDIFEYRQSNSPLIISFPHDGELLSPAIDPDRLTESGLQMDDTDWKIFQVYDFIQSMDISYIRARFSRYVVDLNRSPEGEKLYPGQSETEICPSLTFNGAPIYKEGLEPEQEEIQNRLNHYWQPYHQHIESEIERLKSLHGYVILWDAHSIRALVPRLFDGQLPDLNFGTSNGASCSANIQKTLNDIAAQQSDYTFVFNGRFKGGYITRHYGNPESKIHAVQLELSQNTYINDNNYSEIDPVKHKQLENYLKNCIDKLI